MAIHALRFFSLSLRGGSRRGRRDNPDGSSSVLPMLPLDCRVADAPRNDKVSGVGGRQRECVRNRKPERLQLRYRSTPFPFPCHCEPFRAWQSMPSAFPCCPCEKGLEEAGAAILVKHSAQYVLTRHLGEDPRDAFTTVDLNLKGLLRPQHAPRGTPPLG